MNHASDVEKSREQLLQELAGLRQRLAAKEKRCQKLEKELAGMKKDLRKGGGMTVLSGDITGQKRAEEALRQSEERFRLAARAAKLGAYSRNLQTGENYWSPEFLAIYGLNPGDPLPLEDNIPAMVHPEDRERVLAEARARLDRKAGPEFSSEHRIVLPDGKTRWVQILGQMYFDDQDRPFHIYGFAMDITERKQADAALRESEQRFRKALEIDTVGVLFFDMEGNFREANDAFLGMIGHDRETLERGELNSDRVTLPEWMPRTRQAFQEVVETGRLSPYEKQLLQPDGSRWWGLFAGTRLSEDEAMEFVIDVTDRKQAEEALRQREEEFRALVENAPDVISLFDRNLRRIYVNLGVREYTGQDASFLVGKSLSEAGYPDSFAQPLNAALQDVFATGREETVELDWGSPKGRIWLQIRCAPLRTADGSVERVISIGRDITERKRAEEELKKAHDQLEMRVKERTAELLQANTALREHVAKLKQLNKELEEFSWIASHDLQEPLRKIQAFGSRLERRKASLDPKGREDIQRMIQSAGRMSSLVKALKHYSEINRNRTSFEWADMTRIAEEAASDLEIAVQESGGRIDIDKLPPLEVDRPRMRQLFQNLIGNAIKYARAEEPPVVRISGRVEEGMCHIRVADNGIGFDEKYKDKIFAPFQRLHGKDSPFKGTGIGLAICRKVAQMHGGTITASSTPGKGATFTVSLPRERTKEVGADADCLRCAEHAGGDHQGIGAGLRDAIQ